ncbi:hypothetical protein FRB90_008132 [Tulasnella sp. 427]|nr:hypothetical protein FRB90_008132 [Tulasnella sp. 427]
MSIRDRVRALEQAAAASSSTPSSRPSLPSPRTSLTFSSDDALTAASSSAPASPKQQSSILDDLDSFVFAGPPSSSSSPGSASLSSHRPNQPPPVPVKPRNISAHASRATSPPRQTPQTQPLISFTSPPRSVRSGVDGDRGGTVVPPSLPPRKAPSNQSLNSNGAAPPPLPRRNSPNETSGTNGGGMKRSDSLTIEAATEAFGSARTSRHTHASSTSSFQSLSLSDNDQNEHDDVLSIDDSTATLSSVAPSSSSKLGKSIPPPVPQRPILRQSSGSSSSSTSHPSLKASAQPSGKASSFFTQPPIQQNLPYQVRRTAPPPPLKPSDGSSPLPSPTPSFTASSASLSRKPPPPPLAGVSPGPLSASTITAPSPAPTGRRKAPIPPPSRVRYEDLFDRNLKQAQQHAQRDLLAPSPDLPPRPSPRSRAGWRGTSIDLRTTAQDDKSIKENENKLHGQVVRRIWSCSKLDKRILKSIW